MDKQRSDLVVRFMSGIYGLSLSEAEVVADFITADRKRICEPIKESIRFYENVKGGTCVDSDMVNELIFGIEKSLERAGLNDE